MSLNEIDNYCTSYMMADDRIRQSEIQSIYSSGLSKLSTRKQAIFRMSRDEGLSYQEIANELNLSKNTIENHMVASLRILKAYIKIN